MNSIFPLPIYYENGAGRILENYSGFAVLKYHATPRPEQSLAQLLHATGQLLLARSWSRLLVDQQLMQPFSPEEERWILKEWFLHKVQRPASLYIAIVPPLNARTGSRVQQVVSQADPGSHYYFFQTVQEADVFLKSLSQSAG
ncbi:hypothetical protein [Hymenobacter rigui]|uniref:STAS/SEC14 domain-containing protein n=1 Tax=Hymenobacter rigui TaxID=334424 RepID=A0A428KCC4_9BACT|nr:hypothetical protein [Hymenobacter rigui]RSK44073.1 hypothetical protein EI291_20175 [Hymenobacter rigui]